MDAASRNVALLFEPQDEDRFIALSEALDRQAASEIVLNRRDTLPHLTLRQLMLPAKNLGALRDIVAELARDLWIPAVDCARIEAFGRNIFLIADYSAAIRALHDALLRRTDPLREGLYFPFDPSVVPAEKQHNLRTWGMALVGDGLLPHVTLSRPKDPSLQARAIAAVPFTPMTGLVRSIAIVGCDALGRATEVFEEFAK